MQLNAKAVTINCWITLWPGPANAVLLRPVFPKAKNFSDTVQAVVSIVCTTVKISFTNTSTELINQSVSPSFSKYAICMIYAPVSCHTLPDIDRCEFYRTVYELMFLVADSSFFSGCVMPMRMLW